MISILISAVAATVLTINGYKAKRNPKNLKNNSTKTTKKRQKITKTFDYQDEKWQETVNTVIRVPYFEYQENFDIVPFCSFYEETYKYLIHNGVESVLEIAMNLRATNTLLIYLLWNEERCLLKYFDKAQLPLNDENLDFINLYREHFLSCVRKNVVKYIAKGILVAEVGKALEIPPEDVIDAKDYDAFIYKNKVKLCQSIVNDNVHLINNLYIQLAEVIDVRDLGIAKMFEQDMIRERDGTKILKEIECTSNEQLAKTPHQN